MKLTRKALEAMRDCDPENCGGCVLLPATNRACHMVDFSDGQVSDLALRLAEALEGLEKAAAAPSNIAFNLGQQHEQWPSIREDIAACDAARSAARALLAELEEP